MAANELVAGIAGLAEGIGSYFSERHKLRLEREQKKEREAATEYAKTQDAIQNKLRQGQLEAENKRIDATAKAAEDRIALQKLTLEYRMKRDATTDAAKKKAIDLQYADKFAALGENVFDVASYIDAYSPGGGPSHTMPGMAPSSPVQPGNVSPGVNMQAPQVSNPAAPAMSTLGRSIVSPVQNPQLQIGQPAVPYQQGQPVQPGVAPVPQVRPGTRTADTRAGAGIVFNQNQGTNAADRNAQIKAETEKIEAETETVNNNRRIQNLQLEGKLKEQQQRIRAADDKHRISKQQELLNAVKYDNEVAIGKKLAVQAQIAIDLKATEEQIAKQKLKLTDLDIEIKNGEKNGWKNAADKGEKEAEEAGKDLDKLAKQRVETEGAAAFLWGLKSRGGVEIPNPNKDKGIQTKNNIIKDTVKLDNDYKAVLSRLSEINDRWFQSRYHEAEGEYLKAMGTPHISDSGGPKDKETKEAQQNARERYEAAKKEYLGMQATKEKTRAGVLDPTMFPNFTMKPGPFKSGNTDHKNKKKDTGDPADAFLRKHGYQ